MFKAFRIGVLLLILAFVATSSLLSAARSTDWNNSVWVKIYPINGDGSDAARMHIERLKVSDFEPIEAFVAREVARYGRSVQRPLRIELGVPVNEQPPAMDPDANMFGVMAWSLKMRWWAGGVTDAQDRIEPDVKIFVRYHEPVGNILLENSVGLQKGMVGVVNGYAGRRYKTANNVIIAHEFLHTLGATDKYDPATGQPLAPVGLGEPDRKPLYPQRYAEIMGGRVALAADDAVIPKSLKYVLIGADTAREIRLAD
jgi:hypothetical protein